MIEVDTASRWRSEGTFDRVATILIGIVAILAATFAMQQAHVGLAGTRAQVMAGRLSGDAAAKLSTSSLVFNAALRAQQEALVLGMSGVSRQIAGSTAGGESALAIGGAQVAASEQLKAALTATAATSGKAPLDAYTAGLIAATDADIVREVKEQNRQVDIADDLGGRQQRSILGLSLVTLAGVLAGVSAVLGRGRAGWTTLAVAWGIAGAAAATAVAVLV